MSKTLYKEKILSKVILAIAAFAISVVIGYLFLQPAQEKVNTFFQGKNWFTESIVLKDVYRIFDLGVVDVDIDRNLDIFTSNHNHGQYLLLGDGEGNFSENVTSEWGLDQDRNFPGLEFGGAEPEIDKPGVYIYWKERNLVIKNYNNSTPVDGTITFFAKTNLKQKRNFNVDIDQTTIDTGAEASLLEFFSEGEQGLFEFNPGNVSLPISIELYEEIPLEDIYVGNRKVNPTSHQFAFYLRDRHGMAWSDYSNSGQLDVFIVRGGLKGRMDIIPQELNDEFLVSNGNNSYQEAIDTAQISKEGCPALQTAWVDANNDGLLDLYTVCYRGATDDDKKYYNQLYQQQSGGTFVEVAQQANIAFTDMGFFSWLDADRDGDSDLFWVNDEAFWLYKNNKGIFTPTKIADNPGKVWENFEDSSQLTLADYDVDGDIDIFAALPTGNTLLVNNGGDFELVEPNKIGLPQKSLVANWVDYNNDGLIDLHTIPGGLYYQNPDRRFIRTKMLDKEAKDLLEARATWFDADNNGTRDLVLATRYEDSLLKQIYRKIAPQTIQNSLWQVAMYSNLGANNHWLEIDLVGENNNPQAIGSRVEITTENGVQTEVVGQSDGSHFSQGHYRLYFGLGEEDKADIKVFWSDGDVEEFSQIPGDRRLTIMKGSV